MREIKFRAWDKDFKCWIHFDAIRWVNDEPQELLVFEGKNTTHLLIWGINSLRTPESQNIELSQFTGLKDKNEAEIYEDDLVKADAHEPEVYRIEFIEGGFCATHPNLQGFPIDINHFYPSTGCQLEKVGNFYENPDLLKVK